MDRSTPSLPDRERPFNKETNIEARNHVTKDKKTELPLCLIFHPRPPDPILSFCLTSWFVRLVLGKFAEILALDQ